MFFFRKNCKGIRYIYILTNLNFYSIFYIFNIFFAIGSIKVEFESLVPLR